VSTVWRARVLAKPLFVASPGRSEGCALLPAGHTHIFCVWRQGIYNVLVKWILPGIQALLISAACSKSACTRPCTKKLCVCTGSRTLSLRAHKSHTHTQPTCTQKPCAHKSYVRTKATHTQKAMRTNVVRALKDHAHKCCVF